MNIRDRKYKIDKRFFSDTENLRWSIFYCACHELRETSCEAFSDTNLCSIVVDIDLCILHRYHKAALPHPKNAAILFLRDCENRVARVHFCAICFLLTRRHSKASRRSHTNNIFNNFCIYEFIESSSSKANKISICAFVKRAATATKQFRSSSRQDEKYSSHAFSPKRGWWWCISVSCTTCSHNYLLLLCVVIFSDSLNMTKWHQQRHENLSWEKRRRENIFGDAIIWFISAHVCSSFRCASLRLYRFLPPKKSHIKWYHKQIRVAHRRHHIINSQRASFRNASFLVNIGNVTATSRAGERGAETILK